MVETSQRTTQTTQTSHRTTPMKTIQSPPSPSPSSPSHSQATTPQSFHTMMQDSSSRDYTSPLRAKRADANGLSPERNLSPSNRSFSYPSRNLSSPDNNAIRGNDSWDLTTAETIEPMMQELRTYIHRELSDLKGDMVRQFCEQERIIQEQQEEIERLLKRLNQGGCVCLLPFTHFRGNNRIETQLPNAFFCCLCFCEKNCSKRDSRLFFLFPV